MMKKVVRVDLETCTADGGRDVQAKTLVQIRKLLAELLDAMHEIRDDMRAHSAKADQLTSTTIAALETSTTKLDEFTRRVDGASRGGPPDPDGDAPSGGTGSPSA